MLVIRRFSTNEELLNALKIIIITGPVMIYSMGFVDKYTDEEFKHDVTDSPYIMYEWNRKTVDEICNLAYNPRKMIEKFMKERILAFDLDENKFVTLSTTFDFVEVITYFLTTKEVKSMTCNDVNKALEYLDTNSIYYKDKARVNFVRLKNVISTLGIIINNSKK